MSWYQYLEQRRGSLGCAIWWTASFLARIDGTCIPDTPQTRKDWRFIATSSGKYTREWIDPHDFVNELDELSLQLYPWVP